jgi:hypothetical protein
MRRASMTAMSIMRASCVTNSKSKMAVTLLPAGRRAEE